jgi:hypothetical protein
LFLSPLRLWHITLGSTYNGTGLKPTQNRDVSHNQFSFLELLRELESAR